MNPADERDGTTEDRPDGRRSHYGEMRRDPSDRGDRERRLQDLLDDLPIAVSETTPEGRFLYYSAFAVEMMGYSPEDLAHMRAEDLYVRPEDREVLKGALEERGEYSSEFPLRRADGQVIWVAGSWRAVRDETGRVVLYRGYQMDITERRRQEAEARALQALRTDVWHMSRPDDIQKVLTGLGETLASVGLDFVEYGISTVEDEGGVPQVKVAARQRDGEWHCTELLGGSIAGTLTSAWRRQEVVYHPDLEAADELGVREVLSERAGQPIRSLVDVPFSHGTVSANSSVADAFGERDIAFLSQVGEVLSQGYRRLDDLRALADSESRYKALVETPELGLALMLPGGAYLYVSPQIERWSGHAAQEFYADPSLVRGLVHPDDLDAARTAFRAAAAGEPAQELEYRWRGRGETEYRWAAQISYPVRGDDGRVTAVQAVIQDVTDRRHMRDEQVRLERLRGLGEMAAGVSHNLNNMLTGILAPAEMMMMTAPDDKTRREAKAIYEAGVRASDLVQRLTRSVRGDETEVLRPVMVDQVVKEVVAATRPRWRDEAQSRGAHITVQVEAGGTPPVRATPSGLHDVLVTLVFNAVDALPEGGAIAVRSGVDGEAVWLEVADDGVGMSEEIRVRAPEPFFTTKMTVGTGLGLSTVYGTISRWGGTVDLSSAPGDGTRVRLVLPLWKEQRSQDTVPVARQASSGGRILVVEDEEVVREMLSGALGRLHDVEVATTGQEALALFAAGEYDLAIIDLGLPGMTGDQVARELRRRDHALALVLITGWDLQEGDARRAPFDFCLKKPFAALAVLEGAVAEGLALHHMRKGAAGPGA